MLPQPVNNSNPSKPTMSTVMMIVSRNTDESPQDARRCRFDLFVRIKPGYPSNFKDQKRTWCYRGDKFTDQEPKMLRSLLNLVKNRIAIYDRIELYDNQKTGEERILLKIVDGVVCDNRLKVYSLMLATYALPAWLK